MGKESSGSRVYDAPSSAKRGALKVNILEEGNRWLFLASERKKSSKEYF